MGFLQGLRSYGIIVVKPVGGLISVVNLPKVNAVRLQYPKP